MKDLPVETLRFMFRAVLSAFLAVSVYIGAYAAIPVRGYIDLIEVNIPNATAGQPINILVNRIIHQDYHGGYYVAVRGASGGGLYCTTGRVPYPYDTDNTLPEPVTLAWWAYGGTCTDKLASGLPAGSYYAETCHYVDNPLLIFPRKDRCVNSNTFLVEW